MAVAYESISTVTSNGSSSTATIAKPSGLSVGDVMIAGVLINSTSTETVQDESGWTTIANLTQEAHDEYTKFMWKTADSDDVAASNFIFDFSTSITGYSGFIIRVSGANGVSPIGASASTTLDNSTTPSLNASITPPVPDSLLIMAVSSTSPTATIGDISGYAIATDNPTWTERADLANTGGADHKFAVATASRTATTATGNSSFTGASADSSTDWHVHLIAVSPTVSVTVSASTLSLVSSIIDPLVSLPVTVAVSVLSLVSTVVNPTVSTLSSIWTKASKNIATWTKINKS